MKQNNNILTIDSNYKELLQRTVAVIDAARTNIARQVSLTTSNTYWEDLRIGEYKPEYA